MYAGFDLGGTALKFGVVDGAGKVRKEFQVSTPENVEKLLQLLEEIWGTLKNNLQQKIRSVGFGIPGIFCSKEQKILQSPNYPDLDNFALVPALSRFIDVPFCINNDANMAAYGEYRCGAGQNAHSLVLLTIGTGVGTGIILNGDIWEGACGFAGELGHAVVNPKGDPCKCGSRGCLETEVSAPKIVKNYQAYSKSQQNITAEEVSRRAKNNEKAARQAFADAGRYLGLGLALAINLLNPEKILLGGGVMNASEFLFPPAIDEAANRSFKGSFQCCSIERATLGNNAGFIGAALWARRRAQVHSISTG
ncbi:MAG: ROK family protein [Candidatus Aminicenantes bacterium]|nr:MAG: ROK family protein [Candidatus Aminicenantes bacterium]